MEKTAVITGATSGIGLAFARQLAREGKRIVLCARHESALQKVQKDLIGEFGATVEIFPVDLSRQEEILRLEAFVLNCGELEYMINNAGFGLGGQIYPDNDIRRSSDMLICHCLAVQRLSWAAASVMKKSDRGFIINTASLAAMITSRGAVDYGSTKAFILSFSKSLAMDLKKTSIRVQALCPGFVRTGFHQTEEMIVDREIYSRIPGFFWLDPEKTAAGSLRAVRKHRKCVYIPSLRYRLIACLLRIFS